MAPCNPGVDFDQAWLECTHINTPAVKRQALKMSTRAMGQETKALWLLRAVSLIDLTTLAGDDTPCNVARLCYKAKHPVRKDVLEHWGDAYTDLHTGAVCVYPNQVAAAKKSLTQAGVPNLPIASVATGFPCGQTPLEARLIEITHAVNNGATEIDIVINRTLALTGKWRELYDELKAMKRACGAAHMKAILAIGELATFTNVYKASMAAMMAGADFIKTSTGKEGVNATLPVGLVMARAIREYYSRTAHKVGLKPAGGLKTSEDALRWLVLMKQALGDDWTEPQLFRLGASSLLGDIEATLYQYVKGCAPTATDLAMA